MNETTKRRRFAAAMLVALPPDAQSASQKLLAAIGYKVLTVGHVAAASERLAVVMPILVVAPEGTVKIERDALEDGCVAVGAHVVWLPSEPTAVRTVLAMTAQRVFENG
jgi:hypothetical protein